MKILNLKLINISIITIFLINLFLSSLANAQEKNDNDSLNTIESYYWIGLEDKGNSDLFLNALNKIKQLEKENSEENIQIKLNGLKEDILQQLDMSSDTLYGVFPLTRFFNNNFFTDANAFGTFELFDDHNVIASNRGVESLLKTLQEKERKQLDVIFSSQPLNYALENEALYLFNQSPQFFVHNQKEVNDAFTKNNLNMDEILKFKSGNLNQSHLKSLFNSFDTNDLLIVDIEKNKSFSGDAFYVIKGSYYKAGFDKPIKIYRNMGFSRDRSDLLSPIIFLNSALFLLAVFISVLIYRQKTNYNPNKNLEFVSVVSLSFIVSRIIPFIILPVLNTFITVPEPESLAILSFWYVLFVSIIYLYFPLIIIHSLKIKFKSSNFFQLIFSNSGIIAIVISMSIISWILTSFVIYKGSISGLYNLIIPSALFILNFYVIGKSLDKSKFNAFSYSAIILVVMFFMSITSLNFKYISLVSTLLFVNILFAFIFRKKQTQTNLIKKQYTTNKWLHPFINQNLKFNENNKTKVSFTFLKTIDESSAKIFFKQKFINKFSFLEIECNNENSSFDLVNQLLDKPINTSSYENIESTIETITDFIPFGNLLNMAVSQSNQETPLSNVFEAASLEFFEKIKSQKNICILVTGLNYLDNESAKWLDQLKGYKSNQEISFILIGNKIPNHLNIKSITELENLRDDHLISYITNELNANYDLAEKIIHYLNKTDDQTTLDDVKITFENLKQNKLIYFDDVWYLLNNDSLDENVFKNQINNLEVSINEILKNNEEHKTFLILASCLGYQFDLKALSIATGLSLIETAQKIEEISFKTGIFENFPNPNNKIKFRNRATLNALISVFLLNNDLENIPLTQRTCCFTAATALKNLQSDFALESERIFNLFEKSGYNHIEQIFYSGLDLISNLCVLNQFEKANVIANKCQNYLKNYNGSEYKKLLNDISVEKYFIQFEKIFHSGLNDNGSIISLLDNWLDFDNYKTKLIYPAMRTLYNAKEYIKLIKFIKVLKQEKELPEWVIYDIEHYSALIEIYHNQNKELGKKLLLQCINKLKNKKNNDYLAVSSRIFTSFGNNFPKEKITESLIIKSIEIKEMLSDKPGLARSYGSLTRMYFEKEPSTSKTLENCNKWLTLNKELKDVFGVIFSQNFLGKIYFNLYKANKSNKSNLFNSKQIYNENIKLLQNNIDEGSQIQIFTSYADLMEIAKYEKDEKSFETYSKKLFKELQNFSKIENDFFRNIFKKAFDSSFKKDFIPKNKIKEILG